ncbi:hypothetical protein [Oceanicella sp. SM1341]|uniref:hypothetical protein n=1 Tax=Oceanicella sp. SM1341 TaxID=1548889 RepID=UPI000E4A2F51|nr:hypothetical protein [Oceanicella sp. SM1341]
MRHRLERIAQKLPKGLDYELNGAVVRARCHHCRKTDTVQSSGARGHLPPEAVQKFFINRGWAGIGGKKPACPDCMAKFKVVRAREREKEAAMQKVTSAEEVEVSTKREAVPAKATAAQMSRADRRKVFRAIDDAYSEDGGGYVGGETDHTVASAAGVPVIWVERIREEEFGPAVNEDARKLEADLAAISTKARKAEEDALAAATLAEEASKEALAWGKRFARLRDAMGPKGARV